MDFNLTEEQRMWQDMVHTFAAKEIKPKAAELDEHHEVHWEAIRKMGPLGLLGLNVEERYGGTGLDAISAAIAIEEIGWGDGGTGLALAAHNGLGCHPITLFGTPEQKQRFLPSVVSGQGKLAALALTEPQAGSDLQGIQTRAELRGEEWVINGSKMWITNAGAAEYIVTLVRTPEADDEHAMSMLIVPVGTPGLHIAPPEKKMGVRGSHSNAISYEQVKVP
ncbi:MAG: acyl-CoA dehydrogenase family protein, partial [Anaerolineales bacterium]|nr:acyl-CoA dehydrogenase family protein [Anaerolineales bacterium]